MRRMLLGVIPFPLAAAGLLQQYSFMVRYVKGEDNIVGDALSRLFVNVVSSIGHQATWLEELRQLQA